MKTRNRYDARRGDHRFLGRLTDADLFGLPPVPKKMSVNEDGFREDGRYAGPLPSFQCLGYLKWLEQEIAEQREGRLQKLRQLAELAEAA